jgi:hypothetical protein
MKKPFDQFVFTVNQEIDRTAAEVRQMIRGAGKSFLGAQKEAIDFAVTSREAIEAQMARARAYFDSDEFERHLDEFAAEVGIDWAATTGSAGLKSSVRRTRIATKSTAVVHHCRDRVGATAASTMSITASLIQDPQIIAGVTLACTGGLTLYYVWIAASIVTRQRAEMSPVPA